MRYILDFFYKYFIVCLIGVVVYFIFINFANLKLKTADGSIYLSTAENIARHKGFVVSYNLCQCFNTLFHPIWAYYQPVYSLFASLFINHGGIVQVIKANILLFALNVMIIFYLLEELMPTRLNVLFIFYLVFSSSFFLSALYAWTEQLHFLCFITTFILFLKFKDRPGCLFCLGILNAFIMLIRVAHLYNFMAYFPLILISKDTLRQKFYKALFLLGGFFLAYGLYQLFCLLVYHVSYPEYARPGASYGLARFYSGVAYDLKKVGLQIPLGAVFSAQHLSYIGEHLRDFFYRMLFFLWPALFYYFLPIKKRLEGGFIELCFFQSIFVILGYSLTFYWLTYSFDSLRYAMIPFVLTSIAGWYCLYHGLSLSQPGFKKIAGVVLLLSILAPQVSKFIAFKCKVMNPPLWEKTYYKNANNSYEWIDRNLPKEILVASDEDQQGYFMHRPFISTPVGNSFTCANLALFNRIYSPDYYLLSWDVKDKCFASIAHTKIYSNRDFRILKVIKNKL